MSRKTPALAADMLSPVMERYIDSDAAPANLGSNDLHPARSVIDQAMRKRTRKKAGITAEARWTPETAIRW
jgi:hypothetical protein